MSELSPSNSGPISDSPWKEEFLAGWLAHEPAAAALDQWIYWNNSPLRHAARETLDSFFPDSFYAMFTSDARVGAHVDEILRAKLSWKTPVRWTPEDALWEIAMIAPERLKRLALLSSAFSFQRELAKMIDGALVRQLRKELGEDIFQFVLLSSATSKYLLEPMKSALASLQDVAAAIQHGAVLLVQHAFSSKQQGIQERMATKLPGCFADGCCEMPLPWASQAEQILNLLWKESSSWL